LIKKYFHPDSLILGETAQQVIGATRMILDTPDIKAVILDQNLVYNGHNYLGTDIAKELRRQGYKGVILMRSANTEKQDIILYLSSGADGYLEKSMSSKVIAQEVKAALNLHQNSKSAHIACCIDSFEFKNNAHEESLSAQADKYGYHLNATFAPVHTVGAWDEPYSNKAHVVSSKMWNQTDQTYAKGVAVGNSA